MNKQEAAAKRLKERTASKRFKLPEGTTVFRVLPNAKGVDKLEYIEYLMHSNVGARKAYLRCGHKIDGTGSCWLCDKMIPQLIKKGKKKRAEEMAAKENFAVQIIYKPDADEDTWVGPTLWEMTKKVANLLLGVLMKKNVSDPEKGYNLSIDRTGMTMQSTQYSAIEREDEKSKVPQKFLDKLKPFSEVLKQYDESKQKAEYFGHEQDEEGEETEEEEEKTTSTDDEGEEEEPKSKKKKKPVDEEEESEESTEEEEDEPKAKKKKKPADEEEEEGEEEEEEEPKAKKKKKPADDDEEGEESTEEEEDIPSLEEEEEDEPKSKKKKKPADEEEEGEESEEEEEEKPKGKKGKKSSADEEEEESTEEEEEEPKSKKKKKPADDDDE